MAVSSVGTGGGFQLSAGVNFSEIDQTTSVPAVSTSAGAIGGVFRWGPVETPVLIGSENDLVKNFGTPTNLNPETWFAAANFLAYGGALWVSRAANTYVAASAYANTGAIASASFNALNGVGASNDAIYVGATSPLQVGDQVQYTVSAGNTAITGLTNGSIYWVTSTTAAVNSTANGVTLSTTYGGTKIDITAGTSETGHTLTTVSRSSQTIKSVDDYNVKANTGVFASNVQFIANWPGALGNSLKVSVCDNANSYTSTYDFSTTATINSQFGNSSFTGAVAVNVGGNTATITLSNTAALTGATPLAFAQQVANAFTTGDILTVGNTTIGKQYMKVTGSSILVQNTAGTNTGVAIITLQLDQNYKLSTSYTATNLTRSWEYSNVIGVAPGQSQYQAQFGNASVNDEMHIVVVDQKGYFTGNPGTVLEAFQGLSRATDAKNLNGVTNYYKNILASSSSYIWGANDRSTATSNTAANLTNSTSTGPLSLSFIYGADSGDEGAEAFSSIARAYDPFANKEKYDISLVINGKSRGDATATQTFGAYPSYQLTNYLIDNVAETRKDCVVFTSPYYSNVINNTTGQISQDIVTFRNNVRASSYAFMDSGYKYQYDKYNDIYRWVPLNGDIAGLCAATDAAFDPWYSPAGQTRGAIKNVVKLAYNPSKPDRDYLYQNYVNPVVTFAGQGTLLYGDKTLIGRSSAFDRINVRRLFITLEKAIAKASQSSLFEFNDAFTQAQFVNYVEPYLRDVQGRRGIQDFKVVCDSTNNTAAVIDANKFVGDIYVKPNRSTNFIQLNFVAVGSGVSFTTITGA